MRKVGNMRVPESTHKSKEQLQMERDQREGMLQYIQEMEDHYEKGKQGIASFDDDEKDIPEEQRDKTPEGEPLVFAVMCQRAEDAESGKWYPVGYTYLKQRAMQTYVFINAMNNLVEPKYQVKVIGIKQKDFDAGYGGSFVEKKVEDERTAPTDENIPEVKPDVEQPIEESKEELNSN